jgi:hypothetical protein
MFRVRTHSLPGNLQACAPYNATHNQHIMDEFVEVRVRVCVFCVGLSDAPTHLSFCFRVSSRAIRGLQKERLWVHARRRRRRR